MSTPAPLSISNLVYLQPSTLASLLSDPDSASKTAVIDVRDSDHLGGHIKGSTWVPLTELDVRIPELMRLNKDKDRVVFHCMLSQQRGPTAALKFARAKQAKDLNDLGDLREEQKAGRGRQPQCQQENQGQQSANASTETATSTTSTTISPQVCVLAGGFQAWQAKFGQDDKLTEGYVKDLWDYD